MLNKPLTALQEAFVFNYVCNPETQWNATQSAIIAGYSSKYADRQGSRLVVNSRVKTAIELVKARMQAKTDYCRSKAETEYDEARTMAEGQVNPTAMIAATHGKARLYGLDITKIESDSFAGRRPLNANESIEKSKLRTAKVLESKDVLSLPADELGQATPEGGGEG